jgi:hypothetical protein
VLAKARARPTRASSQLAAIANPVIEPNTHNAGLLASGSRDEENVAVIDASVPPTMLLPRELADLIRWFAAFQLRIGELVADVMQIAGEAEFALQRGDVEGIEWGRWLDDNAHPELHDMRAAVERSLARLESDHPFATLTAELRAMIAELPEQVELHGEPAAGSVLLRRWFELELVDEVEVALIELERTLVVGLRDIAGRIVEVERVLDYYALAVQRHQAEVEDTQAEEFARTGLARVHKLIAELHRRRVSWARRALDGFVDRTASMLEDASGPYRAHRPEVIRRRLDEHERASKARARPPNLVQRGRAQARRAYRVALPLAHQVVTDLRALFGEHDDRAQVTKLRSSLAGAPADLGSDLPLGYRRLFASMAVEIADLYVRRPTLEAACATAIEAWSAGLPQAVLLHGDRGSGKRTLVNHVLARVRSQALLDVRWVRLGPGLHGEVAIAKLLGTALGFEREALTFAELALEPGEQGRGRVIVVENTERLLSPSPAGVARMIEFLALVGATAPSTLWILLMATPAASLALHRLGLGGRIPTIVHVEPMRADELHALIRARHRLSGFELEYADPGLHVLDRLGQPWFGLRSRSPSEIFDERLERLSGGNPRQAMYLWLAHAHPHDQREGRIVVDPLPTTPVELLEPLSLSQRLILAQLAQHGSLTSGELVTAVLASPTGVEGDVEVLWAKGLVAPSREATRHWTLQPTIAHPLLMELRSINMI